LLICIAIGGYLWSTHTAAVSKSGTEATDQARQISGHASDGSNALDSVKTEASNDTSGHFKALLVTDVTAGGAMEKYYGLKKGDRITMEGQYDVLNGGADTASAMLLDTYEKFQPLTVIRDGQELTLPLTASLPAPSLPGTAASAAPTNSTPPANSPAPVKPQGPRSQGQAIQDQLKQIGARPDGE
jgi:hypothetical protein